MNHSIEKLNDGWFIIKDNWKFPLDITISDCCEHCTNKMIEVRTLDGKYFDITVDDDFKDNKIGEETQQNIIEDLMEEYFKK